MLTKCKTYTPPLLHCCWVAGRVKVGQNGFMDKQAKIERIEAFRDALKMYQKNQDGFSRTFLNQNLRAVRREVLEAGCMKTFTISPPPAVGGMVMQNVDPFYVMYDAPWGRSLNPTLFDMLDETIGVLNDPAYGIVEEGIAKSSVSADLTEKGYVFVAMPMAGGRPEYDDVRDTIVQAAEKCGLHAERIDDVQSNDRITDRLLESIRRAEYVVADLTDAKPNAIE
jgi:hypothetical protein